MLCGSRGLGIKINKIILRKDTTTVQSRSEKNPNFVFKVSTNCKGNLAVVVVA